MVLDKASLLDAVTRLGEAERSADPAALDVLLAADYEGYDPSGRRLDRAGVLAAYRTGGVRLSSLARSAVRARVLGEAGIVSGINVLEGRQGETHIRLRLRFLEVWVWREARWQLLASQDTRLPG